MRSDATKRSQRDKVTVEVSWSYPDGWDEDMKAELREVVVRKLRLFMADELHDTDVIEAGQDSEVVEDG